MTTRHSLLVGFLACCLTACGGGGARVMKQSDRVPVTGGSLVQANDASLHASLDWVIVRNGPGSWARNAGWDEFVFHLSNASAAPLNITSVTVVDSLGTALPALATRKKLTSGSKDTIRRYRRSDLKVNTGMGSASLVVAGAAMTAVGVGAAVSTATASLMGGAGVAAGSAAAMSALMLAGPAFAVAGVVRAVRNSHVSKEIETRRAVFPIAIGASKDREVHLFFPLAPSPQRVEINYADDAGTHSLTIDTRQALAGLHLGDERASR